MCLVNRTVTGMVLERCLALAAVVFLLPAFALAQHGVSDVEHVRPVTPQLERLVDTGYRLSTTFRGVVNGLQASSVIVHLVPGVSLPAKLYGALHFVTTVNGYRYLRVSVRTDLESALTIAVLAHELQHAVEIGQAPLVVDRRTMRDHYRLTGVRSCLDSGRECYETTLALRTGNSVFAEVLGQDSHSTEP